MAVERLSPWFLRLGPDAPARIRVFCFPYAGGGISSYRRWTALSDARLEFCAIQLPGHEDRYAEPAFTRLSDLIPPLAAEIAPHLGSPFAFFGHSMGALIAFELARELRRSGLPTPRHLFVSARRAPHLSRVRRTLHTLPDWELKAELRGLDGTPPAVLENDELMELVLPILRADFAICETYACAPADPLEVPIAMFGGADDEETTRDEIDAWRQHSRQPGQVRMFPGGHFFLHEHGAAIADALIEDLTSGARAPS